ncbi:MAG: hypothetical protein H6828_11055 [Planctomycetes bacterium]|nr:hypothetical protein [Planctomycetota bacterium]
MIRPQRLPQRLAPVLRFGLVLGLVALSATGAAAQKKGKDVPFNDPSLDPYTHGDPEVWKQAGIASMGGFEFGKTDTAAVDDFMATDEIYWLETAHFEIGFALGPYKVPQKQKKQFFDELTRLAEKLPEVDPKAKVLDPWLRLHLYGQRLEDLYTEFQDEIVDLKDAKFPDGKTLWDGQGPYMGEGPYLGQKGKYEVLILPSQASSVAFLTEHFGLTIKRTQRWNVVDRDSITVTIHIQQGFLKDDLALHAHLAFNMAHNLYDGLKHYNYDTPIWLHEGLAHSMERRINPKFNSFDGAEGSVPEMTREDDWKGEVLKIVRSGKQARMASLIRLKGYGDIDLPMHYVTWSMIEFLRQTKPKEFAAFLVALKTRRNSANLPDGSNMDEAHRELFQQHLGMSYLEFDQAWAAWVLADV